MKMFHWRTLWIILATILMVMLVFLIVRGLTELMGPLIMVPILAVIFTTIFSLADRFAVDYTILWLAEKDKWWSPYRMKPGGGDVVMLTKGKIPGGDYAMLMHGYITGWWYHLRHHRFYKEDDPNLPRRPRPRQLTKWERRLDRLGVTKVKFFRQLYRRHRRWKSWDVITQGQAGKKDTYGIVTKETKKGEEHIFHFATTMALDLETVPTKDAFPAQMKLVFNVLLIDPEKAEFVAGKWEVQAVAAVRARALQYIQSKTLQELRNERDTSNTDDFVDVILKANYEQKGETGEKETGTVGLLDEYGVLIQGPYYEDFDLESGDLEMTNAIKRQQIAREDVETARIRIDEKRNNGIAAAAELEERAKGIEKEVAAYASHRVGGAVVIGRAIEANKNLRALGLGGDIMTSIGGDSQ